MYAFIIIFFMPCIQTHHTGTAQCFFIRLLSWQLARIVMKAPQRIPIPQKEKVKNKGCILEAPLSTSLEGRSFHDTVRGYSTALGKSPQVFSRFLKAEAYILKHPTLPHKGILESFVAPDRTRWKSQAQVLVDKFPNHKNHHHTCQ